MGEHPRAYIASMSKPELEPAFARLEWVDALAQQVKEATHPWWRRMWTPRVSATEEMVAGNGLVLRRLVRDEPDLPDETGFLVGDLVVNARSCVDMAMQGLVDAGDLKWRKPQFPFDLSGARGLTAGGAYRSLFQEARDVLPPAVFEVITDVQPNLDPGPFGRIEVPRHKAAIAVVELANQAKHRNLTPVAVRAPMRGFWGDDGTLNMVPDEDWPQAWAEDPATVMVLSSPAGVAIPADLHHMVSCELEVTSDKPVRSMGDLAGVVPLHFLLRDIVTEVPVYVRRILKQIERALA